MRLVDSILLGAADLNAEDKPDIVVGNVEAPSTNEFNDGSGRHFRAKPFGDGKRTVYGFASADLDDLCDITKLSTCA